MDASTIMPLKPELTRFLHQFDPCFGRVTSRRYLDLYVEGPLSELPRKSIEPMADALGVPPRNLQEFLGLYRWDEPAVRDSLQQYVARRHAHPRSVGVVDETSFAKKGQKTAGVQRQHCGAVGKIENCVVSVHLGYATPEFYSLVDGELFLPEKTWQQDRDRCRAVGTELRGGGAERLGRRDEASGGAVSGPHARSKPRTEAAKLVSRWARAGRCSHKCAEQIRTQLTLTQQRNATAARSHRRRTITRLHRIGIKLKAITKCHWKRL